MKHILRVVLTAVFSILFLSAVPSKQVHSKIFSAQKQALHSVDSRWSRVAVLGDSITSDGGYIWQLKVLRPDKQFDNYGVAGQTTGQILQRVKLSEGDKSRKELNLSEYGQIIVLCGVNSLYSYERVKSDLTEIYRLAKSQGLRVIAVTLTPWKGYNTWGIKKQKNLEMINDWLRSKPENVDVVIDVYHSLEDPGRPGYLRNDCRDEDLLHPRYKGQRIIGRKIFEGAFNSEEISSSIPSEKSY